MRTLEWLFVAALVFYSTAIWSHKITGKLHPWIVWVFGIGLAADTCGTLFLCVISTVRWTVTLHTFSGILSIVIMAVHFIWALLAIQVGGRFEDHFKKFSVHAWIIWLVAFLSGIPIG